MDLRKTISTQRPALLNPNQFMPPEGDKPVFYSKTGALLLAQRETYGAMTIGNALDLPTLKSLNSKILFGAYFNANITLDPCSISPEIFLLHIQPSANLSWQLPDAVNMINYLKTAFGTENIACNFCWKVYIVNQTGTWTVLLLSGANSAVIGGGITPNQGAELIFVLTNITPGSEQLKCYIV